MMEHTANIKMDPRLREDDKFICELSKIATVLNFISRQQT